MASIEHSINLFPRTQNITELEGSLEVKQLRSWDSEQKAVLTFCFPGSKLLPLNQQIRINNTSSAQKKKELIIDVNLNLFEVGFLKDARILGRVHYYGQKQLEINEGVSEEGGGAPIHPVLFPDNLQGLPRKVPVVQCSFEVLQPQ